jgi:hypothetical protein
LFRLVFFLDPVLAAVRCLISSVIGSNSSIFGELEVAKSD